MNLTNNFDKFIRESDSGESSESIQQYGGVSQARNVCFVQADGSALFISYSNLVGGEINADGDIIILRFVYYTITLKGGSLVQLFSNLQNHMVLQITVDTGRYSPLYKSKKSTVTEIIVDRNF